MSLVQHVMEPTHEHGNTLDLIITRSSDGIIAAPPQVGTLFSHHAVVICPLTAERPKSTAKQIIYRKLKSIDMNRFIDDISTSLLCLNPPEDLDAHCHLCLTSIHRYSLAPSLTDLALLGLTVTSRMVNVKRGKPNGVGGPLGKILTFPCLNLKGTACWSKLTMLVKSTIRTLSQKIAKRSYLESVRPFLTFKLIICYRLMIMHLHWHMKWVNTSFIKSQPSGVNSTPIAPQVLCLVQCLPNVIMALAYLSLTAFPMTT